MKALLCKIKLENIKGGTSCSSDSAGGPSSLSRLLKRARAELAGRMERFIPCGESARSLLLKYKYHKYVYIYIFF